MITSPAQLYPNSSADEFRVVDFDAVELVVGVDRKNGEFSKATIEGKVTSFHANHKLGTSALTMLRNDENALKQAG